MAKPRFRRYWFSPVNRDKYKGDRVPIELRSSWELEFAKHCDLLPNVIEWSYEPIQIPYRDPITNRQKVYIPDFLVHLLDASGVERWYVFEIKPMHEQLDEYARNRQDAATIARNRAKWKAAIEWATRHSAEFMVINESDLFVFHDNRRGRKNPIKNPLAKRMDQPKLATKAPKRKREFKSAFRQPPKPGQRLAKFSRHGRRGRKTPTTPRVSKIGKTPRR